MTCAECREWIQDYLDGLLGERERRTLEEHVDRCPECSVRLARFANLFDLLGSLHSEEVPAGFEQRLMERVREEIIPILARSERGVRKRLVDSAIVSAALIVMVLVPLLLRGKLGDVLGSVAIRLGEGLAWAKELIGSLDLAYRLLETAAKDARVVGTVLDALARAVRVPGEGFVAGAVAVAAISIFGLYLLRRTSRRRYGDASYCF